MKRLARCAMEIGPLAIYSLSLLLGVLLFIYGLKTKLLPTIYWLDVSYSSITGFLAFPVIPLILLILFSWILLIRRTGRRMGQFVVVAAMILPIQICMICATTFLPIVDWQHQDAARIGEHTYNVASNWGVALNDFEGATFVLHECDSTSSFCEVIHSEFYRAIRWGEYRSMTARLIPDVTNNTLVLRINDEAVYVHHLEDQE